MTNIADARCAQAKPTMRPEVMALLQELAGGADLVPMMISAARGLRAQGQNWRQVAHQLEAFGRSARVPDPERLAGAILYLVG